MKLVIETCLESYLVALVKNSKVYSYIFHEKLQKKSESLPIDVKKLIGKNVRKLKGIYVTKGPGSFMGIRAGLLYSYTLAKTLNIDFFTISSLDFVSNNKEGTYYIDAKSNMSFSKKFPNGKEKLVPYVKSSIFKIQYFLENPDIYLNMFKKEKTLEPNYMKDPKVN